MAQYKPKSFWQKPEGITGAIVLGGLLLGAGWTISNSIAAIVAFTSTTLGLLISLLVLGLLIFMALDSKARALVSYMYKSTMRWITGLFIKIDPIAILHGYIQDLKDNLKSMRKQIGKLRGQMHKLKEVILNNNKEINSNLTLAKEAKANNEKNQMILKSRKAGRLKESNIKLEALLKKMEIMYRVLNKMYDNSYILVEDIEDQVKVKEQERKAIMASHSAMKSAMSIIKGDSDKRAMFDQALEAVADDVANKVGEMEQFMSISENFMQSIDLQNGVFEEEGLKMLEKWEEEGVSLLLGNEKEFIISEVEGEEDNQILKLEHPVEEKEPVQRSGNQYDSFFD
jgi:hypothetical protein